MSTIQVQFQGDFSSVTQVPVPVEVVNSGFDVVAEMPMPLGSITSVAVGAPGLYLVRATLPSGERIAANAVVPPPSPDNPTPSATVTLVPPDPSPHETRAWAYSVQGIRRAVSVAPQRDVSPQPTTFALSAGATFLGNPRLESTDSSPFPVIPVIPVIPATLYGNTSADSDGIFRMLPVDTARWAVILASLPDDDSRILAHLNMDRPMLEQTPSAHWQPCYQSFDINMSPVSRRLIVAVPPLPSTEIVLVSSSDDPGSTASPVRPLVKGGDPRADALLSFLAQGAFADARTVSGSISDAELSEIINQKQSDPCRAVIAFYYGLRAGTVDHPDWVKNLADWFPWLPDGAVQYAWCLLRQTSADRASARAYLLSAASRGVPLYSYGLRLLYDGLNLFRESDPNDTEVATAFTGVRRLAAAADWRSAITSLTFTLSDQSKADKAAPLRLEDSALASAGA